MRRPAGGSRLGRESGHEGISETCRGSRVGGAGSRSGKLQADREFPARARATRCVPAVVSAPHCTDGLRTMHFSAFSDALERGRRAARAREDRVYPRGPRTRVTQTCARKRLCQSPGWTRGEEDRRDPEAISEVTPGRTTTHCKQLSQAPWASGLLPLRMASARATRSRWEKGFCT